MQFDAQANSDTSIESPKSMLNMELKFVTKLPSHRGTSSLTVVPKKRAHLLDSRTRTEFPRSHPLSSLLISERGTMH